MDIGRIASGTICIAVTLLAGCSSTNYMAGEPRISQELISSMSTPDAEYSIVQITDDIYRSFSNDHSSLFMVTDHGVVLIDPLNVASAKWLKGEIESKFNKSVTHVLYSHGHADHASGAAVFEGATVISHKNSFDVILPDPSFKDVARPTRTYGGDFYALETGGKTLEMHFVGGNHAADMSYIFFPEESIVFYVDVISLHAIPHGELAWYSEADSKNTYDKALAIDADIAISSHGPVGTQDDVRALETYMTELRSGVMAAMDAGQSLEEIQANFLLEDYADWDYYEQRRPLNIAGMYRGLLEERAE
jgi:glyoxylase-like metal-dependent hydrolase (beta-lactamase superfamily II)